MLQIKMLPHWDPPPYGAALLVGLLMLFAGLFGFIGGRMSSYEFVAPRGDYVLVCDLSKEVCFPVLRRKIVRFFEEQGQ